jgi:hypothetical protein
MWRRFWKRGVEIQDILISNTNLKFKLCNKSGKGNLSADVVGAVGEVELREDEVDEEEEQLVVRAVDLTLRDLS